MSWPKSWVSKTPLTFLLLPLSKLVCWEANRRLKNAQKSDFKRPLATPVLVVGNVVVGGTGKTPFIVALIQELQSQGLRIGVIARGYGGKKSAQPTFVHKNSDPNEVGDEPLLIAQRYDCPVVVCSKRKLALELLKSQHQVDLIISDDGLQHFALPRSMEIVLIDGQRMFGNRLCLPAGPLREPLERLNDVDAIVVNGKTTEALPNSYQIALTPVCFRKVGQSNTSIPLNSFAGQKVMAIAGIGNPARFFETLHALSIDGEEIAFKDHQSYEETSFRSQFGSKTVLMTEKDAVKCSQFSQPDDNWWYLEVSFTLPKTLLELITQHIKKPKFEDTHGS